MSKPQVIITRKDKKLNKTGHLLAFILTGGTSSVVTAAKAATNAGYNARTRQLQAQAESQAGGADRFTSADHERAARASAKWQRCSYCRAWPNDPHGHGPGCPNGQ